MEGTNTVYLGIVGAPDFVDDHAKIAVKFAIDVLEMVKQHNDQSNQAYVVAFGISSGPITAGVMGTDNPTWCIVGNTVQVAFKMLETCNTSPIHISESTFKQIRHSGLKVTGPHFMETRELSCKTTFYVHGYSGRTSNSDPPPSSDQAQQPS